MLSSPPETGTACMWGRGHKTIATSRGCKAHFMLSQAGLETRYPQMEAIPIRCSCQAVWCIYSTLAISS